MDPDRSAFVAAGGDARKLDLYSSIGRVAPFARDGDRCLAAVHPSLPHVGAIGDHVGDDALRVAAEDWLRAQGCKVARGPMELCTWFTYRANLGPFDEAPFAFEPTERPERWLAAGYRECSVYTSTVAEHDAQISAAFDRAAALGAAGWRIDPLPLDPGEGRASEAAFRESVGLFHSIASRSFVNAFGYAPIPEAALQAWYAPLRPLVDPRLVLMATSPQGEPGGFVLALPDIAAPARRWFLIKTLAVLPEHQRAGVGTWLVAAAHGVARKAGYVAGVHCLMWSGSHSNQITRHSGRTFRRYALYEKAL